MKRMFVIIMLLIIASGLGWAAYHYPGYMLMAIGPWRMASTLWFGLLGIFITIITLQTIWALLRATGRLGQRWQQWSCQRKHQQSRDLSKQGLYDLTEGRYADAEKKLLKAAAHSDTPWMNYSQAAKAAQQQQAHDRRDQHLQLALDTMPEARVAIALYQASLQYQAGAYQQALSTLHNLSKQHPKHPQLLRQQLACLQQLDDHDAIAALLPTLAKHKALDKKALAALRTENLGQQLQQAIHHGDPTKVRQHWQNMGKHEQAKADYTLRYCQFLIHNGDHGEAENILTRHLNKHWDPTLLPCYGMLAPPCAKQALQQAEAWLEDHPHDAGLLCALGQLASTLQLWGKAKDYYSQSLQRQENAATHFALAALYQQSQDTAKAQQHINTGLKLAQPDHQNPATTS